MKKAQFEARSGDLGVPSRVLGFKELVWGWKWGFGVKNDNFGAENDDLEEKGAGNAHFGTKHVKFRCGSDGLVQKMAIWGNKWRFGAKKTHFGSF